MSRVLHLHTARSIALSEAARDFVDRVRESYPLTPSHKALLKSQGHTTFAADSAVPLATPAPSINSKWGVAQCADGGGTTTTLEDKGQPHSEASSSGLRLPMLISACPGAALVLQFRALVALYVHLCSLQRDNLQRVALGHQQL